MARVSDAEVKRIISTELDTTPFITTANVLVNQYLGSESLSDALMRQIELYWSAHLVALREPQPADETVGRTKIKYQGKTDMMLKATFYGQTVLTLDPTGILDRLGRRVGKFTTIQSPTEATPTTG